MATATDNRQQCLQNCQQCAVTLNETLINTCLQQGGEHLEANHIRLMLDCVAACTACVSFMSRQSEYHERYCGVCAEICRECASSCENMDGMQQCAEACRRCEQSCSAMAA